MYEAPLRSETRLIVDTQGKVRYFGDEPSPGSVVLTKGVQGTAWQRHFADGRWYPARREASHGRTWDSLLTMRNTVLVYEAPAREQS